VPFGLNWRFFKPSRVEVFDADMPSVYARSRQEAQIVEVSDGFLEVFVTPDAEASGVPSMYVAPWLDLEPVFEMAQQESSKDVSQKCGPENPA
jgi:hypothetical protein